MLKLIQVTGSSLLVGPASVAVSAAATTVAALAVGIVPGQVRLRKMAPTLMICWSLYYLPGNFSHFTGQKISQISDEARCHKTFEF